MIKIGVYLNHPIRCFRPDKAQFESWKKACPHFEWIELRDHEVFLRRLPEFNLVISWRFCEEWYAMAPKLRWVVTPMAGRETIVADPKGKVQVIHGAYHGKFMRETLLAYMLYFVRELGPALREQKRRLWNRDFWSGTSSLSSQKIFLLGYGSIARECAKVLMPFGCEVRGFRRHPGSTPGEPVPVDDMEAFYRDLHLADHLVLTLPAGKDSDHLVDDELLSRMKPGAFLYNMGRGNAVDSKALIKHLRSGHLGGAWLDVFMEEPLPPDHELWAQDRLMMTPHSSAMNKSYLDGFFDDFLPRLREIQKELK